LTETYGPTTICPEQDNWREFPAEQRAKLLARQGQAYISADLVRVVDEDMNNVARDGETMGEVVMRGNIVMSGYFDDSEATAKAFRGGWFHSGDLAVWHSDGNVELRDRGKDIIISGGENISSIEVEQTIAAVRRRRHPPPALGRAAEGVRNPEGLTTRDRRGDHRVRTRPTRALQVPRRGRVRTAPEDLNGEGAEVRAPPEGLGRKGHRRRGGVKPRR
jgi:acyl-CoA synthetase (AMP-forming)/AMP-acid ligase II